MSHAVKLGQFVTALNFEALPADAIEAAKRHIFDTVGVALMGAREAMPRNATAGIAALPGSEGAIPVWGTSTRLSAPYAALVNGISAHVLDFDDTHTAAIVHGSAILAPVVFALGQELERNTRDVITAFVAGWEVAARVGIAARGTVQARGFHTSSIAGVFGAAAAAGKLLNLNESQMVHAIGLAGSQASGINEYQSNGSSSKMLHIGWAAHSGMVGTYLARAGMTAPCTIFEGRLGLFAAYGDQSKIDVEALSADLGTRWESTRVSIKPYSCCHLGHAFIDCARALRKQGVKPTNVETVECVVPELAVAMVCEPLEFRRKPLSPYAAKFSLPFMVAAALTDEMIGHGTFTPQNILRQELIDLARRVSYRVALPDETTFPKYFPGWLRGRTTDGTTFEERQNVNRGAPENPLSQGEIEAKFRDNLRNAFSQSRTDMLVHMFANFERASLSELLSLMGA